MYFKLIQKFVFFGLPLVSLAFSQLQKFLIYPQVDRHCLPFSKLLKAARKGKFETIVKTKLEELKKSKSVNTRMLDIIINILPGICFSGESTVQTTRGGTKWNQYKIL